MKGNRQWQPGTEKILGIYHSENDPQTVHLSMTAKNENGENVLLRSELRAEDLVKKLDDEGQVKVTNTIPFEVGIGEQKRGTEFRRSAAA